MGRTWRRTSLHSCSEDPDVKGTETALIAAEKYFWENRCSEDPDVKGTETVIYRLIKCAKNFVAARIPM